METERQRMLTISYIYRRIPSGAKQGHSFPFSTTLARCGSHQAVNVQRLVQSTTRALLYPIAFHPVYRHIGDVQ